MCQDRKPSLARLHTGQHTKNIPKASFEEAAPSDLPLIALPDTCRKGHARCDVLTSGAVIVEIEISQATENIRYELRLPEDMCSVCFHLGRENQTVRFEGEAEDRNLEHKDTVFFGPHTTGSLLIEKGKGCHEFGLLVPQEDIVACFEEDRPSRTDALYRLCGDGRQPVVDIAVWTASEKMVVDQMRACPYRGSLREIYLESKVMELVVLRLDILFRGHTDAETDAVLTDHDRRMLREARDILESSMKKPPTIKELARMVGTNRTKLKYGFRALYGACVFEHLRHYRMEHALSLLRDTDGNVSEVASAVGYSSVSAFSAVFHRTFGFAPREAKSGSKETEPPP